MKWIQTYHTPLFLAAFAFAALAAPTDAEMPLVSAEGRLVGAYQDNVDAAFVCLVIEHGGNFNYAFIGTNDTASVLKKLQPLVGRHVSVSGRERIPHALNRAVTKRQIMVPSLNDVRIVRGKDYNPFDVSPLGDVPPSFDELSAPSPRKAAGTVTARWQDKAMLRTTSGESLIVEFRDGIDLPAVGECIEAAGTPISDTTAHGVLNAVRELVANAVRHGGATKIRITGEVRAGALGISVRDDGCGFDLNSRPGQSEGHFGLDGIAERIERLGGTFEIESSPGGGTKGKITISTKGLQTP